MKYPIRTDYNRDHYRFRNTCEGYYPDVPKSPGWAWFVVGAALGMILLALVIV